MTNKDNDSFVVQAAVAGIEASLMLDGWRAITARLSRSLSVYDDLTPEAQERLKADLAALKTIPRPPAKDSAAPCSMPPGTRDSYASECERTRAAERERLLAGYFEVP